MSLSVEDVPSWFNVTYMHYETHMHAQLRNEHPKQSLFYAKTVSIRDIQYSVKIWGDVCVLL